VIHPASTTHEQVPLHEAAKHTHAISADGGGAGGRGCDAGDDQGVRGHRAHR
jgi:hypothetical protein